jgi:hypothetical protein
MSGSPIFEWLCDEISGRTTLGPLQSRGTVRLALKEAGLEPRTISKAQALVIVERLLPRMLQVRGVANFTEICTKVGHALRLLKEQQAGPESAEAIFARLGKK